MDCGRPERVQHRHRDQQRQCAGQPAEAEVQDRCRYDDHGPERIGEGDGQRGGQAGALEVDDAAAAQCGVAFLPQPMALWPHVSCGGVEQGVGEAVVRVAGRGGPLKSVQLVLEGALDARGDHAACGVERADGTQACGLGVDLEPK